ncbi:Os01g0887550 [Oryza sativa Japonica Group]|uniref:Os01g0887550 protein n=1 Tax=Oryza sativa subsp. japonica TaxID=39947 RepID=A0A0P0VBC3_ORYSJ|nr:hypothetical protein EE612_007261 [Oryza sativa]BAS75621.1 Os01g0887550 [Oryza sativa Japonica Group]
MYLLNIHARVLAHHRFSFLSFLENLCRWRIDCDDIPMAYPYVEFQRGLPIEI